MISGTRSLSSSQQALGLVGWLVVTFAAAGIGALATATATAGEFYGQLVRPSWAPAASVFGPVWTVLYALMAVAAWLVWRSRGFAGARGALILFVIQLAANSLWSWLFFAWHRADLAFAEILVLWVLIVATVIAFNRISRVAAALLYPYLAWSTFASALTWVIWRLNLTQLS